MNRGGFTLVEMVVVLLILAVAAAVTVPALLEPRQEEELDAATRRIETLFRLARDSAARAGVPVTLTVDSVTGGVWLEPERVRSDVVERATSLTSRLQPPRSGASMAGPAGESLELPATVRLELTAARARFTFAHGGASFGDTVLLRRGAAVRVITLDPWSGHARVH